MVHLVLAEAISQPAAVQQEVHHVLLVEVPGVLTFPGKRGTNIFSPLFSLWLSLFLFSTPISPVLLVVVHHPEEDLVLVRIRLLEHEDPEDGDAPVGGVGLAAEVVDLNLVLQLREDRALLGRVLLPEGTHLLAQGKVAVGTQVRSIHLDGKKLGKEEMVLIFLNLCH